MGKDFEILDSPKWINGCCVYFLGGRLIIETVGVSEDGIHSSKPFPDKPGVFEILEYILEDMVQEGKITQVCQF